jgi:hypothetical protein
MGILDKLNKQTSPQLGINNLNQKEIEILLSMIKRTTFLGEDIEFLYTLVVKLQEQYLNSNQT